jgi:NDP-sugar pyrophosphorylase family protein
VAILTQGDDAPCGLMLIRCGILRQIQSVGFVDLREQALPHIARSHRVHIVPTAGQALLPTRTREDYIRALRLHAAQERGLDLAAFDHPFAESWQTSFAIVEPGAVVHPSARIHDSVVLAGARVGREALVAYSVVGPGGVVPPRGTLVNEVLGAARPPADRS